MPKIQINKLIAFFSPNVAHLFITLHRMEKCASLTINVRFLQNEARTIKDYNF